MKPDQMKRIQQHGETLLQLFPNAQEKDPVTLCKKLRRLEVAAHKHAEILCNGGSESVMSASERSKEKIGRTVAALLGDSQFTIFVNDDPRGYALKIDDTEAWKAFNANLDNPRLERDWGGYGILAPEIK